MLNLTSGASWSRSGILSVKAANNNLSTVQDL